MAAPDLRTLLALAPTIPFKGRLVRCIAQLSFQLADPPSYLFTSGLVNRCNPQGIQTLYMSEDRATALAEFDGYFTNPQPQLIYHADYEAAAVIDLGDHSTRRHFSIQERDLFEAFRVAKGPTPLQRLGAGIAAQKAITAIRYPSNARRRRGEVGYNFAIFPNSLQPPDSLSVVGPDGPLEVLPQHSPSSLP